MSLARGAGVSQSLAALPNALFVAEPGRKMRHFSGDI